MLAPDVVAVTPYDDYKVEVAFADGKIVMYSIKHLLGIGVFRMLADQQFFKERCTILNHTLAWDVSGDGDPYRCIDIDPDTIYRSDEI